MDWCFKMTSWDFTQMQQDAESNISSLGGFNNLELKRKGDCSVDLKLGRIEDSFDGLLNAWSGPQVAAKVSHSGLPKRNRTISNAGKTVSCLVDGCQSDLSNCRDYHKRHKVCELHAKTPFVMVEGLQQRFCQQCSRFHLLREFDEIKRSCRRRLDGHNRRRRKVQPDPLSASSASLFHSFYPGSRFSSDPQMPTGKMQDAASLESFSARHYPSLDFGERQPLFSIYSSSHRSSSTNFPFVRSSIDASSTCQPPLTRITSSESNRALSLLSLSNPSSDINTVPVVQADIIPMVQPLNSGFKQYSHSERLLSCSSNSDLCNGNSCSQLSNCMSTNSFPPETKNQLENTSLSGGVGVVPCQVSFRVAGADTEPVYSPASHTLPIFWPS